MRNHRIRSAAAFLLLWSLLHPAAARATDPEWQSKVEPRVLAASAAGPTEFFLVLAEQADLRAAATLATRSEKGAFVYRRLVETAKRTQAPLLAALDERGAPHRSFWVANMILVTGNRDTLQSLASRPDVALVRGNPAVRLREPAISPEPPLAPLSPDTVEWNVVRVRAPEVWALGYTGQGAVVGGQDTGYQWDHPALKNQYRGWNGTTADHDYAWHDAIHAGGGVCGADSPFPCDDNSHGTHTMGTAVGDDGGVNQIGVAPGATWIGCRNMNEGWGTPATYSECYQWFIAPTKVDGSAPDPTRAPDVINNSWGCPPAEGCTEPDVLLAVVNSVRAAGILTVHSAGNSGPACSSIDEPAAIYAASFTVGSVDGANNASSFSSRGPVTIDGSGRRKPDVTAPGEGIRSSVPGGGYAGGWSGTSMAAPHVAGLAALLISSDATLAGQPALLEDRIEQGAVGLPTSPGCGDDTPGAVPNNVFGWGRIDALASVADVQLPVVSVVAANAVAAEPGANTGAFRVSRTGIRTNPLTVLWRVEGGATAGVDYLQLPASVVIPAGAAGARVAVRALNDARPEPAEAVRVTLLPDAAYSLGGSRSAAVVIRDDD